MSGATQRPVSRRSVVWLFYLLALGAGVFRTVSVSFDFIAIYLVEMDAIVFGFISQWISYLVVLLLVSVLSIRRKTNVGRRSLGYELDPDFGRIRFLPKTPMFYMLLSGIFAGVATFFYYILIGQADASTVLPYGQLVIAYLLVGDLFAEKDTPTIIEVQCLLSILFGVLLIGVVPGGFDVITLIIVLIPMNISSALVTYYQRKTKRYEISPGLRVDSLNMRLWSLLFLNLTYSLIAFPLVPPDSWNIIGVAFGNILWVMVGSSVATFLSLVLYIRALGRGSMAVVNALSSISVVLGIPLTLLGDFFLPGIFGTLPSDGFLWMLKIFGVIMVLIGVISLQAADVRSIALITVRQLSGDILPELFDIKGVESAAAVAGAQDYILSIKSRSLGKTRSNILKKIQAIPEVEDIKTLVVLRDFR